MASAAAAAALRGGRDHAATRDSGKRTDVSLPPPLRRVKTVKSLHVIEHHHNHYHYFVPHPELDLRRQGQPQGLSLPSVNQADHHPDGALVDSVAADLTAPPETWQGLGETAGDPQFEADQAPPLCMDDADDLWDLDVVDGPAKSRLGNGSGGTTSLPNLVPDSPWSTTRSFNMSMQGFGKRGRRRGGSPLPSVIVKNATKPVVNRLSSTCGPNGNRGGSLSTSDINGLGATPARGSRLHLDKSNEKFSKLAMAMLLRQDHEEEQTPDGIRRKQAQSGFSFRRGVGKGNPAPFGRSRELTMEELRKLPPVEAVRQALICRCGSLDAVYELMDVNRNGEVSLVEFQSTLSLLGIDTSSITGTSVRVLFKLLDTDHSGELSIDELLGYLPDIADSKGRSKAWSDPKRDPKRDTKTMWRSYYNQASESRSTLARDPCWSSNTNSDKGLERIIGPLEEEMEWTRHRDGLKRQMRELSKGGPSQSSAKRNLCGDPKMRACIEVADVRRVQKEDLERTDQKVQKIQRAMRDCGRSRRQIVDLQKVIRDVDGTKSKSLDSIKQQADKKSATVKQESKDAVENPGAKRPGRMGVLLRTHAKTHASRPLKDAKLFVAGESDLRLYNDISDTELRELAQKYEFPIDKVEEIKREFDRVDTNNAKVIQLAEFETLVRSIHTGDAVRDSMLGQWWAQVDADGSGKINFRQFLLWWAKDIGF